MGIRGRKEGGEGDPYLRILEKFWESRAAKKGFVGDCFFSRGDTTA